MRRTWDFSGEVGWYVGPALTHYRCVTIYFPRSRATRICDTVTFLPHDVPFPEVSLKDYLKQAASDIITILTQPPSTTVPSLEAGDPTRNALLKLAKQLGRMESLPEPITPNVEVQTKNTTMKKLSRGQHYMSRKTPQQPEQKKIHLIPVGNDDMEEYATSPRVPPPRVGLSKAHIIPEEPEHETTAQYLQNGKRTRPIEKSNTRYDLRPRYPREKRIMVANAAQHFRHLATQQLTAMHIFSHKAFAIYNEKGKKETIDTVLAG